MRNYPGPNDEPTCLCGAQLDESDPTQCRKCRARSRWQRRRTTARRSNRHMRPGPFFPPSL